jgi:hypothetical protein
LSARLRIVGFSAADATYLIGASASEAYISHVMRRLTVPGVLLAFLTSGCVGTSDADDTGTSEGTADAGTSGGTDGATEGEPEPEFEPIHARGISISFVEANHGVEVPIMRDGEWIDGPGRTAQLFKNRNTFFRALWELDDDFEPRDIDFQMTFFFPDGSSESATRRFFVGGPSSQAGAENSFSIAAPAEFMVPGVHFQIELFETDFGYEDTPAPAQTAWPEQPAFVGIEESEMELRVLLVPIKHELGSGCPDAPDPTEEEIDYLRKQLFNQNPVQHVEFMVHPGITYTSPLNSFGALLQTLAGMHDPDDPGTYIYGVIRPCDGGPEGVGGQAISIPGFPTKDNYWARTSVGRWYGSLSATSETFVHEVGHCQGRRHVRCNGSEGGVDPQYPHEGGNIGIWGYGAKDGTLRPPSHKDYMTYCGTTWVSDYGWQKVVPYIREITSWYTEAAPEQPSEWSTILVGLIDPDAGTEHWFTTHGSHAGRTMTADRFEITTDVGVTELDASIGPMGEGNAYNLVVELPKAMDLETARRITRIHGDDGRRTEVTEVRTGSTSLVLTP